MRTRSVFHVRMVGLGILLAVVAFQGSPGAQQSADTGIRVGASDLGGVVTSANGPEAGVWVENVGESGSAEASYYTWVDQFDTFGLGKNVPIATGNANESLLALVNGRFVNLRVPYPLGFYAK